MATSNGDVYILGTQTNDETVWIRGYWLNNTIHELVADGWIYNTSVTDSAGAIIYGYYTNNSGTPFNLPSGTTDVNPVWRTAIVSGNILYVKGSVTTASGIVDEYWANGVWTVPTDSVAGYTVSYVSQLFVSGSTLYVGGNLKNSTDYLPGYWVNGSWTSLSYDTSYTGGSVSDMAVYKNTVYAGGGSTNGLNTETSSGGAGFQKHATSLMAICPQLSAPKLSTSSTRDLQPVFS